MSGGDTISDAVVAGSGAGEVGDAIQASKRKKTERFSIFKSPTADGLCSNCGTQLSGPVCHSCGQTSDTFHRPVWDLFMDVVDGLLGLEGRLWRTLPPLMFQPGKLTQQYLSGVRARFVMPFRLYLTASVLFFLAFSLVNSGGGSSDEEIAPDDIEAQVAGLEEARQELEDLPPGIREQALRGIEMAEENVERSAQAAAQIPPEVREQQRLEERNRIKLEVRQGLLPEDYPEIEGDPDEVTLVEADEWNASFGDVTGLPYWFRQRLANGADRIIDSEGESLWTAMKTWAPRLLFGLLPIYALLLAATHFYKKGLFFYDHLVVSLHFHAFLFFQFIILGLVSLAIGPGWAILVFFLWSNYYLYRLHRTVYAHGRISSFLRTAFMDFVYMIILSFGFLALMLIGVLANA